MFGICLPFYAIRYMSRKLCLEPSSDLLPCVVFLLLREMTHVTLSPFAMPRLLRSPPFLRYAPSSPASRRSSYLCSMFFFTRLRVFCATRNPGGAVILYCPFLLIHTILLLIYNIGFLSMESSLYKSKFPMHRLASVISTMNVIHNMSSSSTMSMELLRVANIVGITNTLGLCDGVFYDQLTSKTIKT